MQNLSYHIFAELISLKVDRSALILRHNELQGVPVHFNTFLISLGIFSLIHVQFYIASLGYVNTIVVAIYNIKIRV